MFMINNDEANTAAWRKIKTFLESRLSELRNALERRNLPQNDAEYYRGQVFLIREILNGEEEL